MQQATANRAATQAPHFVMFRGVQLHVSFSHYSDNQRTAICLGDIGTGEPYATATVNIPEIPLEPTEVLIKDYSENAGILEALERPGIVRRTGCYVRSGFVEIPVCELLVDVPANHLAGNAHLALAYLLADA